MDYTSNLKQGATEALTRFRVAGLSARLAAVALLVLLARASPADASWTRLTAGNLVIVGDGSAREVRDVADRLELFRSVVGRALGREATTLPVPTVVLAFRNARSFAPFAPLYQGRPVRVAGYFIGGDDVNYIALNGEDHRAAYSVVCHEFAHALVSHMAANPPAWLDEGLAGFYETFAPTDDGRGAVIGAPNRESLQELRNGSWIPLSELLVVDRETSTYNEGRRRTLFYAQSWALVHYLTFGQSQRSAQFRQYLAALGTMAPQADAFREAFGDVDALEGELREYVKRTGLSAVKVDADAATAIVAARSPEPLADEEAAAYLGDALARLGRIEDARRLLRETLAAAPRAGRAMSVLGVLEIQSGNDTVAMPLLEQAASFAPEVASVQSAYGRALVRRAERGGPDEAALYRRASAILARALELDPGDVPTSVTLAAVLLSSGIEAGRAVDLMRRVVQVMPGQENYRLLLARALAAHGEYAQAIELLGPLVARGSRPEMRETAREVLGAVAAAAQPPVSGRP